MKKLIDAGLVVRKKIPDFETYGKLIQSIISGQTAPPNVIVVDTIGSLATWTRHEVTASREMHNIETLWKNSQKLTMQIQDWGRMSDLIGRTIYEIRSLDDDLVEAGKPGITMVLNAHVGVRENELDQKIEGPNVNKQLLEYIQNLSDVIVRINVATQDMKTPVGDVKAGKTRLLDLAINPKNANKYRTDPDRDMPSIMIDPTLPKLEKVLGERPRIVGVYGLPGAGKTTFACSYSTIEKDKK